MDNVWLNPRFANTNLQLAILADRDGTLIRHIDYISEPTQVELLLGVKESVHPLIERGIPFLILTNQSGVGRGKATTPRRASGRRNHRHTRIPVRTSPPLSTQ